MKKVNEKGFTLAELLIVVAIIAVLVAVAIPTFNNELEKSREAADIGNLRTAYAAATAYLSAHPENTVTKLYFNPSAPESISTIKDDNGAKIGRKATAVGQQSGDAKINFNTDYTFGPTTGLGAGKNLVDANAVIEISVNTKDNSVSRVSFEDDQAPLSVTWKINPDATPPVFEPTVLETKEGATTFTPTYNLADKLVIKVFGTELDEDTDGKKSTDLFEENKAPTYKSAAVKSDGTEDTGSKSSLGYYGLGFASGATAISITGTGNKILKPTDGGGAITYIPIKMTATVKGASMETEKILYVPIQIAPKAES